MSANSGASKKVIFFDLHGTLIPKKVTPASALGVVLQQYTARWDSEDKSALIKKACKIYNHALTKYARNFKETTSSMRMAAIKRALAILPLPSDEAMLMRIDRDVMLLQQASEEKNRKTIRLLKKLKSRYQLAIISNGKDKAIRNKLRRYRLNSVISSKAVFASERLGKAYSKPHPAIFQHALKQMGIKAQQAIVIGDSWHHDIAGAARSGIDAVWLNPFDLPLPQQFPNVRVTSVRDLTGLVDFLL